MPNLRLDPLFRALSSEPANNDNPVRTSIKRIGAAIRHDLNNPLQEIVALAHVARSGKGDDETLDALQRAANGLARKVDSIEDKMLRAVEEPANDNAVPQRKSVLFFRAKSRG